MTKNEVDHSVFNHSCIYLVVYVDHLGITKVEKHLFKPFPNERSWYHKGELPYYYPSKYLVHNKCSKSIPQLYHIDQYIKGDLGKDILFKDKGYTWVVRYLDAYQVSSTIDKRSISRFCIFVKDTLSLRKARSTML